MKKISLSLITLAVLIASLFSCNKDKKKDDTSGNGFDKTAMLTSYADNLIIPAYSVMQQKLAALQTTSDAFIANPSVSTQASVKTAYTEAHLQYVKIAIFNFGPAENSILDNYLNFSGGLDYNFTADGELTGFSVGHHDYCQQY